MSKFAYVTLVMKGDFYVPGALVLASSLRRTRNQADIICMVTSDVSATACSVLSTLYTHVVPIDYITMTVTQTFKCKKLQEYYNAMTPFILTKFRCLLLEQYDKVLLLGANVVVLRSLDAIFETQTPAACFHNYWCRCPNLYPSDMQTGDVVPRDAITRAFEEKYGYVLMGSPILLSTGADIFRQLKDYIEDPQTKISITKSKLNVGLDESLITMFFTFIRKDNWRYIGTNYAVIPWKDKQPKPFLYQYIQKKPWTMQENTWPDLKPWFDEARYISDKYPETHQFFQFLLRPDVNENGEKLKTLLFRLREFNE